MAIVEDEATVRRSLERLLRARGIDSESFSNGEKFLRYLGACRPDCVIFGRPAKRGGAMEALLRMTAEALEIPILVLAGRRSARPRKRPGLAVVKKFPAPPAAKGAHRRESGSSAHRRSTSDRGRQK